MNSIETSALQNDGSFKNKVITMCVNDKLNQLHYVLTSYDEANCILSALLSWNSIAASKVVNSKAL